MTYQGAVKPGWGFEIFEMFTDQNIVPRARSRGYLDYKHILYGNSNSGPLSLRIHVAKSGTTHLCSPPGNWGKLPNGFQYFWEAKTAAYLTPVANAADVMRYWLLLFVVSYVDLISYLVSLHLILQIPIRKR